MHKIKDCVAIQTNWYTPPSGCTGGDYWNEGEIQVICPVTDHKNRLLFSSKWDTPYELRNNYDYNAEVQFKSIYKKLFKEVIQDHGKDKRSSWINYYVDKNLSKFDVTIKQGEQK